MIRLHFFLSSLSVLSDKRVPNCDYISGKPLFQDNGDQPPASFIVRISASGIAMDAHPPPWTFTSQTPICLGMLQDLSGKSLLCTVNSSACACICEVASVSFRGFRHHGGLK
jgi:hypothetical protein